MDRKGCLRTPPLVEFRNVTVVKGSGKKVLDRVSITIREGENLAILGPNGAGKSSFIRAITREYYPVPTEKDLSFRVLGEDTWNIFDLRSLLGIVSNELQHTCTKEISGMEMVLSGFFGGIGLYHDEVTRPMRKKANEVIEFLEIEDLKDRKMTEMSSGEARKCLIARALVHDPKALIFDEPTSSLDLHALYKLRKMMRKISSRGVSVILVTQSLQDIIPEITRIVMMKSGRFVMDGPKEKVLTQKNVSALFSTPVRLMRRGGYYYAFE